MMMYNDGGSGKDDSDVDNGHSDVIISKVFQL